ncbi:MAG: hypothetical protein AAF772_19810, partial [Acidobacteriota bacterium]
GHRGLGPGRVRGRGPRAATGETLTVRQARARTPILEGRPQEPPRARLRRWHDGAPVDDPAAARALGATLRRAWSAWQPGHVRQAVEPGAAGAILPESTAPSLGP